MNFTRKRLQLDLKKSLAIIYTAALVHLIPCPAAYLVWAENGRIIDRSPRSGINRATFLPSTFPGNTRIQSLNPTPGIGDSMGTPQVNELITTSLHMPVEEAPELLSTMGNAALNMPKPGGLDAPISVGRVSQDHPVIHMPAARHTYAQIQPVAYTVEQIEHGDFGTQRSALNHLLENANGPSGVAEGPASDPSAVINVSRSDRSNRASGILLHITSLPSRHGIGDLGAQAREFVDFLTTARQKYWQILPITPTEQGAGNSPYSSNSAFAANTYLISPDLLVKDGWLQSEDIPSGRSNLSSSASRIDYAAAIAYKEKLFDKVWQRYKERPHHEQEFQAFKKKNASWLDGYALFISIKAHLAQDGTWNSWPKSYRNRDRKALQAFSRANADRIERIKLLQFIFRQQWDALRAYAHGHGVQLIGDIPIYVGYDSADVWEHPEYFQLDKGGKMTHVAGVPPDYFSATGQLWGNPLYNWKALGDTDYRWWMERLRHTFNLVDKVRIDHFRGFIQYWRVPAAAKTAMQEEGGHWAKGPDQSFFKTVSEQFAGAVIAEDLGIITPDVVEVMERFGFPGMKVLQFAFGDREFLKNPYLPHNHVPNSVVYTGTHDNNTTLGWLMDAISELELRNLHDYLQGHGVAIPQDAIELAWEVLRLAMNSPAQLAIFPMQDVLGLDSNARMNIPSTPQGNWGWQMLPGATTSQVADKLRELTKESR